MKKTLTLLAILALGLTACNKVELQNSSEKIPEIPAEAPACYFKFSAAIENDPETKSLTLGESTASFTFEASDSVYVYIVGQGTNAGTIACGKDKVNNRLASLTMENINGASCDLSGALKFYYGDTSTYTETPYTPAVGDIVYLFCDMYGTHLPWLTSGYHEVSMEYNKQTGAKDGYVDLMAGYSWAGDPAYFYWGANHYDFSAAKMKITAVAGNTTDGFTLTLGKEDDPTDAKVSFRNMQSMFRQRLAFTDKVGDPMTVNPTIAKFTISTANDKVVYSYYPFSPNPALVYSYDAITILNPVIDENGDIYFALMFNDDNKDEALILTAEDAGGNVYSVTKPAPTGGFANGKYYYGTATLAWQKCKKPTITGTAATPYDNNSYMEVDVEENPAALGISGYSEDYSFILSHGGTVTLDNVTAQVESDEFVRLDAAADLDVVLTGINSLNCGTYWAVHINNNGNLRLSCTGASATLTVTTTNASLCGIRGSNYTADCSPSDPEYNHYSTTTELDVTAQLAAPGFTVTRSARTDNADGTYSWTYTVEDHRVHLNSLTSSYTAQDGDVLTGELPGNLELNIASGATVTLAGMTHHAGQYIYGIKCEGSANIILAAGTTNDLTRDDQSSYFGIGIDYASAATLTISGTGTLLASGGAHYAGIGSHRVNHNIVINGGDITATGGQYAPGIGASNNTGSIGNITINGGTVTATGGYHAVGIGAAVNGSYCTGITIGSDITSVSIQRGPGSTGFFSATGAHSVIIDGKPQDAILFATSTTQFPNLDSTLSTTTDMDDTWTLTHK